MLIHAGRDEAAWGKWHVAATVWQVMRFLLWEVRSLAPTTPNSFEFCGLEYIVMTQEASYRASVEFWHEADDIKRFQVCFDALLKYTWSVILQMSEGPFVMSAVICYCFYVAKDHATMIKFDWLIVMGHNEHIHL